VSTVLELQKSVEERAGLSVSKQGVLFGGQKLKPSDVLDEVGVQDGSEINIVPSSSSHKKKASAVSTAASVSIDEDGAATPVSATEGGGGGGGDNVMEELLKQAGIDSSKFDELMQSMGGGGADSGMPDMKQSMDMMKDMMNSPMFQQYFQDPERLEQSRQMILQNPMMKSMMAGLPGFDEILGDEVKWRETMMAASKMYQEMGSMMGGAGGMFGDLSGGNNAALDELSEGDE